MLQQTGSHLVRETGGGCHVQVSRAGLEGGRARGERHGAPLRMTTRWRRCAGAWHRDPPGGGIACNGRHLSKGCASPQHPCAPSPRKHSVKFPLSVQPYCPPPPGTFGAVTPDGRRRQPLEPTTRTNSRLAGVSPGHGTR